MITIGTCVLGEKPRVAVALRDDAMRSAVEPYIARGLDMVEMRIDNFSDVSKAHVLSKLREFSGLPRIGTIRSNEEGGGWQGSERERLALYENIVSDVEAVDIEIGADIINHEVIKIAKRAGITIIGSFHDFQMTPDNDALNAILERGKALGVDIVKIAAHCDGKSDLQKLARFLVEHPDNALIVIGMGAAATPSRILFPALGSLVAYTFLGEPSAPGQLDCDATIRFFNELYPGKE